MTSPFFTPVEQPQEFRPPKHANCTYCDKPIHLQDRAVYIHHGELGEGRKSGQPIVVDSQHTAGDAVLHETCSLGFMLKNITDSADDLETLIDSITQEHFGVSFSDLASEFDFCGACGVKIEDTEDE